MTRDPGIIHPDVAERVSADRDLALGGRAHLNVPVSLITRRQRDPFKA